MRKFFPFFIMFNLLVAPWTLAQEPPEIRFQVQSFQLEGELPVAEEDLHESLSSYLDKEYSLQGLQGIAKSLEQELRQQGYAFYRVVLPAQSLADSEVTFKVVSFSLGELSIEGNKHFDHENILASLPGLEQGASPNIHNLAGALKVANHHDAKQLSLKFKQSNLQDKIDASINVQDESPWRLSLLANNTGNEQTGEARVTLAAQHSNIWNRDHNINLSYTTSPDYLEEVEQYGFNYVFPWYWGKAWINSYYSSSNVDSGTIAESFDVTGSGENYGVHYLQYLPKGQKYEHWLDFGIDNRLFESEVSLVGISNAVNTTEIRSVPVSLMYKGEYPFSFSNLFFHVQYVINTPIDSKNDDEDYSRNGLSQARQDWHALRYGFSANSGFYGWALRLNIAGQYSDNRLISGEQFGLGGSQSIRGYEERETSVDMGNFANLELYSPVWLKTMGVVFFDYGEGELRKYQAEDNERYYKLASAGVGVRWQWHKKAFFSLDMAHTFEDASESGTGTEKDDQAVHANLLLSW